MSWIDTLFGMKTPPQDAHLRMLESRIDGIDQKLAELERSNQQRFDKIESLLEGVLRERTSPNPKEIEEIKKTSAQDIEDLRKTSAQDAEEIKARLGSCMAALSELPGKDRLDHLSDEVGTVAGTLSEISGKIVNILLGMDTSTQNISTMLQAAQNQIAEQTNGLSEQVAARQGRMSAELSLCHEEMKSELSRMSSALKDAISQEQAKTLEIGERQGERFESLSFRLAEEGEKSRQAIAEIRELLGRASERQASEWNALSCRLAEDGEKGLRAAEDLRELLRQNGNRLLEAFEGFSQRMSGESERNRQETVDSLGKIAEAQLRNSRDSAEAFGALGGRIEELQAGLPLLQEFRERLSGWMDRETARGEGMNFSIEEIGRALSILHGKSCESQADLDSLQNGLSRLAEEFDKIPQEVNRMGKTLFKLMNTSEGAREDFHRAVESFQEEQKRYGKQEESLRESSQEKMEKRDLELANEMFLFLDALDAGIETGEGLVTLSIPKPIFFKRAGQLSRESLDSWLTGIKMMRKRVLNLLSSMGIQPTESLGAPFDPNLHNAVAVEKGPDNVVVREVTRGYRREGRVLRYAQVVVGKSAAVDSERNEQGESG